MQVSLNASGCLSHTAGSRKPSSLPQQPRAWPVSALLQWHTRCSRRLALAQSHNVLSPQRGGLPYSSLLPGSLIAAVHLTAVEAIPAVYPSPGESARRGLPSKGGAPDGAFLPPLSPTKADAIRADGPGADSIWGKADPGLPVLADGWELRAQLEAVAKAAAGAQALAAEAVKQVTCGFWTATLMQEWCRATQRPRPWQRLSSRCLRLGTEESTFRWWKSATGAWALPAEAVQQALCSGGCAAGATGTPAV